MTQHGGEGLYIHAVGQRQSRKSMPKVVEARV